MRFSALAFLLSNAIVNADDYTHSETICIPSSTTINVKLNTHTSELGYYTVEGCEGIQPVLGLEKNVQYTFVQSDISNYYHPLGFAYYPDGAHEGVDELEPGIAPPGSSSTCTDDDAFLCPAPMYLKDGTYLGVYSNNAGIKAETGDEDFGLDVYEPEFFATSVDWSEAGTYSVALLFDVDEFTDDIFYFCHIHSKMSGRIKWVDGTGAPLSPTNSPTIDYEYEVAETFDQGCGTYGISSYQLPHPECPAEFVCDSDDNFSQCIDAMNCRMTAGMTAKGSSGSAAALFINMMIPHHRNAVNMAKALMYSGELECDDYASETPDCILTQIAMEIIAVQNHQIQNMQGIADEESYPGEEEDDCKVVIGTDGQFNIMSDSGMCVTPQKPDSASVLKLKACGKIGQRWVVDKKGNLKNTLSKMCILAAGKTLKTGPCKDAVPVYQGLDGTLNMVVGGMAKAATHNSAKNRLELKKPSGDASQEFSFEYK